jgi:hypothetical protein
MDAKSTTSAPLVEKLSAEKKKNAIKSFFGAEAKKEEVVLKKSVVEPPIVEGKKSQNSSLQRYFTKLVTTKVKYASEKYKEGSQQSNNRSSTYP